jgi:class 3 adenylate cyclase
MQPSAEQIAAAITALEAQRALLGDGVVDTALAPLRRELAALQAASTATSAQQLKQVSVLFVDVVGSTAIGQQLDPETIHLVMDSALERFTAVVQGEGGRVLQYTGDGMLAAFSTAVAAEDDVECDAGAVDAVRRRADLVRHKRPGPRDGNNGNGTCSAEAMPLPVPSIWGLMFAGLCAVGAIALRRRVGAAAA